MRGGRPAACAALAAAAVVLGWDARRLAEAHARTSTFGDVEVDGAEVDWTVRVRARDLGGVSGVPHFLAAGLHVTDAGAPCPVRPPREARIEADPRAAEATLAVRLTFVCRRAPSALALRYDLFFADDALHSGYTTVRVPGRAPLTTVFRAGERTLEVAVERTAWQSAGQYLRLGVEHILTGYDHLAFLAALLLGVGLGRRARPLVHDVVRIVTAFTVAHSVTLLLSTLVPGLFPTRWVEPTIALSIAYVGVENLFPHLPGRRWGVAFLFGLVHGLGFSSVLREVGLPARGRILSLLSFNLGVELGQLAVVAVALPPLVAAARRWPRGFERWFVRAGSAALVLAGLFWFAARVRG